jgi:hypothetical protein
VCCTEPVASWLDFLVTFNILWVYQDIQGVIDLVFVLVEIFDSVRCFNYLEIHYVMQYQTCFELLCIINIPTHTSPTNIWILLFLDLQSFEICAARIPYILWACTS